MSWLSETFIWLMVSVKIFWLQLNQTIHRFIQRPLLFNPRRNNMNHSVVVIGDGFAEGFGDWVILFGNAGISEKIPKILQQKRAVRQRWTFFNRGHYGSTSFDWIPQCETKPSQLSFAVEKSLFHDTFDNPRTDWRIREAEIVLICVCAMDHLNAGADGQLPTKTFENIKSIAEELTKRGKIVVISMIPLGINGQKRIALDERNKLLQKWLDSKPEGVHQGPDPNSGQFRQNYTTDNLHFNSQGYTLYSSIWVSCIKNLMIQVEWKSFQAIMKEEDEKKKRASKKDN